MGLVADMGLYPKTACLDIVVLRRIVVATLPDCVSSSAGSNFEAHGGRSLNDRGQEARETCPPHVPAPPKLMML